MGDPEIVAHQMPVTVVGTDDQGRTVVMCPIHLEAAPVDADGRIRCPTQEAMDALVGQLAEAHVHLGEAFRADGADG